jgi:peptide subunit release factor 1 (eRF1)
MTLVQQQVASLRTERSNSTTLISYYIRGDSANQTGAFLRNELQQSNNIKSKATRDGVQDALRAILRTLKDVQSHSSQWSSCFCWVRKEKNGKDSRKSF